MRHTDKTLGWFGIFRLGLVQAALGAIIVLTTSTLNRVMVVELALPASLPGLLVGWHYAVQITRPRWGYGADLGGRRSFWILAGLAVLALGAVLAAAGTALMASSAFAGIIVTFAAFTLIGGGVGAAGTNLLALLAVQTPPERKAAAAAIVWIMMIAGFVITTAVAAGFLEPFSMGRLFEVTVVVSAAAWCVAALALFRLEARQTRPAVSNKRAADFRAALASIWQDNQARRFTVFVFVSMLAYSAQDLILEPFAGLVHGFSPAESTRLASLQNGGVLIGMVITAVTGTVIGRSRASFMRHWTLVGCVASAFSLALLAAAAIVGPGYPLKSAVFALGVSNGLFAVAAIGSMMTLASAGKDGGEGTRMGVWGAAQALAFGLGGLLGAVAIDLVRLLIGDLSLSFAFVFAMESATFVVAGYLALRVGRTADDHRTRLPFLPAEPLAAE
ncbi:MAG: BCD family MFS transporter [Parvularcula sp.]|nr:BCD family MFS transporter [Parvularcula sp.]